MAKKISEGKKREGVGGERGGGGGGGEIYVCTRRPHKTRKTWMEREANVRF